MYFLDETEKRYVLRKLLPEAREQPVHPDLRGWNWSQPPLAPIYDVRLGLWEVAGQYCTSRRDVYLRRVEGITVRPNLAMIEGATLHKALAELIISAKRIMYIHGRHCRPALEAMADPPTTWTSEYDWLEPAAIQALAEKVRTVWRFEHRQIMARLDGILARQPHLGPDALVALTLPITVEQRLDGRFLGLSSHLSADAFNFTEPMMVDLKFGPPQEFDRLTTAGYAMVMESLSECPINVGCVVHVQFRDGELRFERDFHLLSDELRQWFIEARDELARLVDEEIDPGLADPCYETCPYWDVCHSK